MTKHGQWICNTLKREFMPERECYRLITGEDVKYWLKIIKKRRRDERTRVDR